MGDSRRITTGYDASAAVRRAVRFPVARGPVLHILPSREQRSTIDAPQQHSLHYLESNNGAFYLFDYPSPLVLLVLPSVRLVLANVS